MNAPNYSSFAELEVKTKEREGQEKKEKHEEHGETAKDKATAAIEAQVCQRHPRKPCKALARKLVNTSVYINVNCISIRMTVTNFNHDNNTIFELPAKAVSHQIFVIGPLSGGYLEDEE